MMLTVTADTTNPKDKPYRSLVRYVQGRIKDVDPNEIRKLRRWHKPKSGMLYRGLAVDTDPAIKILNNKGITLKRKRFPLISWSRDIATASYFANESMLGKLDFGLVLAVNVPVKDRVVDISDKGVIKGVRDNFSISESYGRTIIDTMESEKEVLVEYNPRRNYNLCKNVVRLFVRPLVFQNEEFKSIASILFGKLSAKDITSVVKQVGVSAATWPMWFECNSKGALSLYS